MAEVEGKTFESTAKFDSSLTTKADGASPIEVESTAKFDSSLTPDFISYTKTVFESTANFDSSLTRGMWTTVTLSLRPYNVLLSIVLFKIQCHGA